MFRRGKIREREREIREKRENLVETISYFQQEHSSDENE